MRTVTRLSIGILSAALLIGVPSRATAVFHLAVIDEILTGYGGDANVQFIEIRMLSSFQTAVSHSVFAAFDSSGTYIGDILEVPGDVSTGGADVRWLIGTEAFQSASGVTPDFIMPAGVLPPDGGMVCFGGGGGLLPANPPSWDRTNFATYVDCVAYGTYSGEPNVRTGTPTDVDGNGHSLQRVGQTHDNAADFACADSATPENNDGGTASLPATTPCGGTAGTPTATEGGEPTPSPTGTTGACVGDCNGNSMVTINELVLGVTIALGSRPIAECEALDCQGTGTVPINCLIQGVNNAVRGCGNPPPIASARLACRSTAAT